MGLDSIVSVDISISAASISKPGFGTTLILSGVPTAVETAWATERVRTYNSAAAMLAVTEGFTVADQAYKLAVAAFSQNPKPKQVKVGRRTRKQTQIIHYTPTVTTAGHVYGSTIEDKTWTYTVLSADDTVAKVVAKLVAAINTADPTHVTATDGTTHVILTTSTTGLVVEHKTISTGINITDATVNPGIETDFAECAAADGDFYKVVADAYGADEVGDLATAIEATRYKYDASTVDSGSIAAGSSDIGGVLNAAATFRTSLYYNHNIDFKLAAGAAGVEATKNPGTYTMFGKTVSGALPSDHLSETQVGHLNRKKINFYQSVGGVGRILGGWVSGGEYSDTVRGIDWLRANMQVNVANALFAAEKIPNTNDGRQVIKGQISTSIEAAMSKPGKPGLLAPSPAPVITMPDVSDTESFDSVTRTLSGVSWSAALANAIHAVVIQGVVTE